MYPEQILILGAYGQRNLGDDALLEVFLEQLKPARLAVNSASPAETSQRYGVEVVATYSRWPRLRRPRILLGSDAIVFGGGSLLKELEGGLVARLLYFLRIFLLLLFARLMGRPSAMLGVGMGPLNRPIYRWLARHAANLTDLICVRDHDSHDLLRAIGVTRPVYVTADPVFTMTANPPAGRLIKPNHLDKALLGEDLAPRSCTVAVIPRYSLGAAEVDALVAACDHMVEAYGARILLIPFQTGYQEKFDDAHIARQIMARMGHADAAEVLEAEGVGAAMAAIGAADLVLSARLHGLIFAALGGVPGVGLDYEVKVRSFMREIGQGDLALSLEDLAIGRLPGLLDTAWASRRERAAVITAQVTTLRVRSRENFSHFRELTARPKGGGLLSGGAMLFVSMTVVNAGNYLFNLVLGRWLGPSAFADLSLMITALLMITMVTATLQTISAKFSAMHAAAGDPERVWAVRAWLGRWAWGLGGLALAAFALGAPTWQGFFQSASPWPFVILGLGLPLYFAQGVDRGVLQGQVRFGALALSYQAEMWVRLVGAVILVAMGWSVNGAVAGVTLSLAAAWLAGWWPLAARARRPVPAIRPEERAAVLAFCGPVLAALVGQVIINNSDILIVKHFFSAEVAGHYAALALIGRIVFFATLSVVAAMFPIVAQKQQRGEPHRHLLWLSLGLVVAASLAVIAATLAIPALMVRLLFGEAYLPIVPLLWLYGVATMLYAMANVVINYRLSTGDGGGSALSMAAGLAQVAGLWLFHASLEQVVLVQVVLMIGLLAALLAWDWWLARKAGAGAGAQRSEVRLLPLRRRWRPLLLAGAALAALLLMWQVAGAQGPGGDPGAAQQQLIQIMPALRDSEAEQAAGAYIPGVGAVITLDLLRGPNTFKDKPADAGVRDWAIYLMGAFGPRLSAVPPGETIAISVSYYDFAARTYHQLVISSAAASVKDSATYRIWLDGQRFGGAASAADAPQMARTRLSPEVK
ncbi:MAG: polysaccharide pyruvyl transferase family protein [Chloroflexales bacterium]